MNKSKYILMRKRGSLLPFETLIKFILGIIVLIITVTIIWKIVDNMFFDQKKDPSIKSFEALVEEIENLKDGEQKQVPVYTKGGYSIMGFEQGKDSISGACRAGGVLGFGDLIDLSGGYYKKNRICGDSGCLCLFKIIIDPHVLPGSSITYEIEDTVLCKEVKRSIKGGIFKLEKDDVGYVNFFQGLFHASSNDKYLDITCDFGIIPSFDGVGLASMIRDGDTVYLCWGKECAVNK